MKYKVYPVGKNYNLLRGFCPTTCKTKDEAEKVARDLERDLKRFGVKYEGICTEEVK